MKLIKKFTEGKYSGYQIKQMTNKSFSVYLGKTLIKNNIKDIDSCYRAIRMCEDRYKYLQENLIQCAIQAYRKTEEHTMCTCKDIANLEQHLLKGKKCGNCEMVEIFETNLRNIIS